MLHNLSKVFWVCGIEYVEEVISAGISFFWVFILKVYIDILILFHLTPKVLNR